MNKTAASVNEDEIAKFTAMADEWWSVDGKFKPLHKFNPVRIDYIVDTILKHKNIDDIKGISILDIGCGGGLLSEPLAKLGADVTGIDVGEKNIKIAKLHAKSENLNINYVNISTEELAESGKKFDVVLNMEVLEHVASVESFLKASASLVKDDGIAFFATLNRTPKSFAFAVVGAEYVLRWLPKGTHNWKKFLKPSEIEVVLRKNGLKLKDLKGISYNPIKSDWHISDDVSVNYIMCAYHDK